MLHAGHDYFYSFFGIHQKENPDVRLKSAIEAPARTGVSITHVSTFSGNAGGIDHPINEQGEPTNVGQHKRFDGLNAEPGQ